MWISIALTIGSVLFIGAVDLWLFPTTLPNGKQRHPMPIPADEAHAKQIIAREHREADLRALKRYNP
jgi:hypothetical protein